MKMKKKAFCLSMVLCLILGLSACGSSDTEKETVSDTTGKQDTTVTSPETTTKSENTTQPETTTELETTTEPEKVYDVYVNGVGYDKGVTLEFKITLTAPDKEFTSCCPSINVFMEGVTGYDQIAAAAEIDPNYDSINPILINNVADMNYGLDYPSFWGYFDLLAKWESPNAEPLDITNGVYLYSPRITFKEAGNYTVTVTSGNGDADLKDEFAKYDNCFTFTVTEVK